MGNLAEFVDLEHWDFDRILPNLEMEQMPNLKYVHIEGDNGDALMHPHITKLLDHIMLLPSQPVMMILTNGGMRKPKWWRELGQRYQGRLRVQFSIDGLADTNPLYRVDINHQRVLDNARAFIEGGGDGAQRCIIFKHNQHQIKEIVKQAEDIGMTTLVFIPNDSVRFQDQEKWAVYDHGFNITHYIENTEIKDLHQYNYYKKSKIKIPGMSAVVDDEICPEWKSGIVAITYKGHVIPCCMYQADLYFDHPSNDRFRELAGDTDLFNVNLHKLSWILDPDRFYGTRLSDTLRNKTPLMRCQVRCPDIAGGKRIIPIKEI